MDYIIVEMDTKNDRVKYAIKKINNDISVIRNIIYLQYYLLSYTFLILQKFIIGNIFNTIYQKKIIVDKIFIFNNKDEEKEYLSNEKTQIILYEKGIIIQDTFIPYENIISFGEVMNFKFCCLELFAEIKESKIILNENVIKLIIQLDNPTFLCDIIKKNMYYHIKYNKINEETITFYKN